MKIHDRTRCQNNGPPTYLGKHRSVLRVPLVKELSPGAAFTDGVLGRGESMADVLKSVPAVANRAFALLLVHLGPGIVELAEDISKLPPEGRRPLVRQAHSQEIQREGLTTDICTYCTPAHPKATLPVPLPATLQQHIYPRDTSNGKRLDQREPP